MDVARISAASTQGQQPFLLGHLRAVPIPEMKNRPRDFSPGATIL